MGCNILFNDDDRVTNIALVPAYQWLEEIIAGDRIKRRNSFASVDSQKIRRKNVRRPQATIYDRSYDEFRVA